MSGSESGKPAATEQIIEVEADSLEEARRQVESQIPEGLHLLSEQVISDGNPKTIKATADTIDEAFTKAEKELPANATILEKKGLTAPERNIITVEGVDEHGAESNAHFAAKMKFNSAIVKSVRLVSTGKKSFLGIGVKPNQYEAELLLQATVEVTYKSKAKIYAKIGEKSVSTEEIALALKGWYRNQARQWWQNNSRQSATCDDGNEMLRRGEGYLRPGGYLCCEQCTNNFLFKGVDWDKAILNLESYFGPGLPEHIKKLTTR
jgi:hypothetical protein